MKRRQLFAHPFVIDNVWYGLTSLLVNIVNYSFILMVVHFLDKTAFGAFSALVSVLTLAAFLANPLQLFVTRDLSQTQPGTLLEYFARGNRQIVRFTGGGFIILAALTPMLSAALTVPAADLAFVWLVAISLILASFANGISSGLRKLSFQASLNLFATVAKFVCTWLLFAAGWGMGAGLSGYLVGFSLTIGVTWAALRRWQASGRLDAAAEVRKGSIVTLLLTYLFIAVPLSLDQILVQVLNTKVSGDYAALATLGKLGFYTSSPFLVVLYSYLVKTRNDQALQMKYFLFGSLFSSGAALLVGALLAVGGRPLVGLVLSSAYLDVSAWVPAYSLGICGYVFSYAVALLAIVRDDRRIVAFIGLASLVQLAMFSFRNATLGEVVTNQVVCLSVLSAASAVYLLYDRQRRRGRGRPAINTVVNSGPTLTVAGGRTGCDRSAAGLRS